jgi:hypothetical protein
MLRLIKGELEYLKPIIYVGCLVILVKGLWSPWMTSVHIFWVYFEYYNPWAAFGDLAQTAFIWHIIFNLALLYRYMMEARVRQQVSLPVPLSHVLASRLAAPLFAALLFLAAGLIPIIIHSIIMRDDMIILWNYYISAEQTHTFQYYQMREFWLWTFINVSWMSLFAIYGCWAFSERYGWYLFGAYLVFVIVHNGLLLLFDPRLAWAISDFITSNFINAMHNTAYICGTLVFVGLIIVSFITRRSYLR